MQIVSHRSLPTGLRAALFLSLLLLAAGCSGGQIDRTEELFPELSDIEIETAERVERGGYEPNFLSTAGRAPRHYQRYQPSGSINDTIDELVSLAESLGFELEETGPTTWRGYSPNPDGLGRYQIVVAETVSSSGGERVSLTITLAG